MCNVSICMATYNKAEYLRESLASIRSQEVAFPFEVVVVDDGSTDNTYDVCKRYGVDQYIRLESDGYRNPGIPRNIAYRAAKGEILILQSDDVIHPAGSLDILCSRLIEGTFVIIHTFEYDAVLKKLGAPITLSTREVPKPFFFLGSVWRSDVFAVGGNDEDFQVPGAEDNWFADCLIKGQGLMPVYVKDMIALHQTHKRPKQLQAWVRKSRQIYQRKLRAANAKKIPWKSSGGAWDEKRGNR